MQRWIASQLLIRQQELYLRVTEEAGCVLMNLHQCKYSCHLNQAKDSLLCGKACSSDTLKCLHIEKGILVRVVQPKLRGRHLQIRQNTSVPLRI